MRASPLLLAFALTACRPPAGATTSDTATTTSTTGATSTTGPVDACERSNECDTDGTEGICVAEYLPADTLGGERGPAVCATPGACVEELDLGRWCFDHPGCCEGLRCRAVDGICERPGLGQDTDTDTEGGSDTEGTSTTASTTDATTTSTTDATTTGDTTGDGTTTSTTSG